MQWYKTPEGKERLDAELELLEHEFPQMKFGFLNDGTAIVSGYIYPNDLLKNSYFVVAKFPDTYGDGNRIKVYLPEEELPPDTPHLWDDGEISLDCGQFTPEIDIIDVLGWTIQWLVFYEEFSKTGRI